MTKNGESAPIDNTKQRLAKAQAAEARQPKPKVAKGAAKSLPRSRAKPKTTSKKPTKDTRQKSKKFDFSAAVANASDMIRAIRDWQESITIPVFDDDLEGAKDWCQRIEEQAHSCNQGLGFARWCIGEVLQQFKPLPGTETDKWQKRIPHKEFANFSIALGYDKDTAWLARRIRVDIPRQDAKNMGWGEMVNQVRGKNGQPPDEGDNSPTEASGSPAPPDPEKDELESYGKLTNRLSADAKELLAQTEKHDQLADSPEQSEFLSPERFGAAVQSFATDVDAIGRNLYRASANLLRISDKIGVNSRDFVRQQLKKRTARLKELFGDD